MEGNKTLATLWSLSYEEAQKLCDNINLTEKAIPKQYKKSKIVRSPKMALKVKNMFPGSSKIRDSIEEYPEKQVFTITVSIESLSKINKDLFPDQIEIFNEEKNKIFIFPVFLSEISL